VASSTTTAKPRSKQIASAKPMARTLTCALESSSVVSATAKVKLKRTSMRIISIVGAVEGTEVVGMGDGMSEGVEVGVMVGLKEGFGVGSIVGLRLGFALGP